ncbi:MAG: hypothetical protein WBA16_07935 [Nonlabens sp.]
MKHLTNILLLLTAILLVSGLYGFAGHRAARRTLTNSKVIFTDYANPLISEEQVKDLLNLEGQQDVRIDTLDLHSSEARILENELIKRADVSIDLAGNLLTTIEQRVPVVRIMGASTGYIDQDYRLMPLSTIHTAHLPLVMGYNKENHAQVIKLLSFIKDDSYMAGELTQIIIGEDYKVDLRVRTASYAIKLGEVEDLENKFFNYKAFLASITNQQEIDVIRTIDLRFKSQVITNNN